MLLHRRGENLNRNTEMGQDHSRIAGPLVRPEGDCMTAGFSRERYLDEEKVKNKQTWDQKCKSMLRRTCINEKL